VATHGKNVQLTVGTNDISPYLTNVATERDNDVHDTTTYGASGHTFITGLTNGKITVTGLWDKTATVGSYTVFHAMLGSTSHSAFIYGPAGSTTGNVKISGNCWLVSYAESAPVADLVTFTAVLQIDGAVTDGTY
jgi:hypothetical protein